VQFDTVLPIKGLSAEMGLLATQIEHIMQAPFSLLIILITQRSSIVRINPNFVPSN